MKKLVLVILIGSMAFSFPEEKKLTIWLCGDSTMAEKETRAFPETGWGMPFIHFFDSTVVVRNLARNGRSTKTFISENRWQIVLDEAQPGDYVFIQFGHNDEAKDKVERYTSPEEFKANLKRFIEDSRKKKAIPVLFTPVSRRRFDSTGNAIETHKVYSGLTREVAKENEVTLIDLDTATRSLYQQFGKDHSKLLFLQLKPGEHPNYPAGRDDNTHFNELGARLVAQLVLSRIREQLPELATRIIASKNK